MTKRRYSLAPLPLFAHAEASREALYAERRRARLRRRLGLAGVGIALLGSTIVSPPLPRLVWNASASAPRGLYAIAPGAPVARGDIVAAWPPAEVRTLAASRRYIPSNVPLVKRVYAVSGDRVCAFGRMIYVDRRAVAARRTHDADGRPLPQWHGCMTFSTRFLLLLNDTSRSFDGRYFGPSRATEVIGKATPLWLS